MKKLTRDSVKGTYLKNVILFPNGRRSAKKTVENLATAGIQLHNDQIVEFASSVLNMYKAGHREVNITCWLKKRCISFTGAPVLKTVPSLEINHPSD